MTYHVTKAEMKSDGILRARILVPINQDRPTSGACTISEPGKPDRAGTIVYVEQRTFNGPRLIFDLALQGETSLAEGTTVTR